MVRSRRTRPISGAQRPKRHASLAEGQKKQKDMGKKQLADRRTRGSRELPDGDSVRETVLETLLQLHLDFAALGRLDDAGPLLYKLMEVAYYTAVPAAAVQQNGTDERKSVLN